MARATVQRVTRACVVVSAAIAAAFAASCASAGMPPGGPPDAEPPVITSLTPKTMTTGAKLKDIEIKFDEVISETPKGATDLRQLVFISPLVEDTDVNWHRNRLTIRPKGGWKPNTVYSVQLSPGVQDLRNNAIDSSIVVVFSTGGEIPDTRIVGTAFDWIVGRGATKALVEAIAKDSTTYQILADSVGRFDLRHVPPGEYLVRSIIDRNNNRLLDPTEAFDSVRVTMTSRADVELYAFPHDTVGLRIADVTAQPQDSLRVLRVTFDKPLAPGQTFTRPQFIIKRADSTIVGVALVQTVEERAAADSVEQKRKADSVAAATPGDTAPGARERAEAIRAQRSADSVAAIERAAREARRVAARTGGRIPPRDTLPPPKMRRPVVHSELYLTLETRLLAGTPYRLQVNSVQSLSGTVKSPSRQFVTARAVRRDSAAAPTRRPP